jgi:hypothetical protein
LCGADTGTLRIINQICLEILEMYCWRRLEEIVGTYRVKNYVLCRVKKTDSILNTTKRRRATWICCILCTNCLLRYIIKGKIEGTRRQGRRRMQLLDDLREQRKYWKLKDKELERSVWVTRFGSSYKRLEGSLCSE